MKFGWLKFSWLALFQLLLITPAYAGPTGRLGTPAENRRGLSWMQDFGSQPEVERDGGIVIGNPTFSRHVGVTLNGSDELIIYTLIGDEFNSDSVTVVIEFYPDFDYDNNSSRTIFDASESTGSANLRYFIGKLNNANNNVLSIEWADSFPAAIPSATYGPYWFVQQRNVLVMSMTSGDNDIYLNDYLIMSSNAQAWTPKAPLELRVGARYDGGARFDGSIHPLRIFHVKFTAQEAIDYTNNSTFTYLNKAVAHWDFTLTRHDPTNVRTLDVFSDFPLIFGDGSTPATYPTKTERRGYLFDGSDDAMTNTPIIPQPALASYSIETYARWDGTASLKTICSLGIEGSGDSDTLGTGVQGGVGTNDEITYAHWASGAWRHITSGIIPTVGQWYHIVGVNDGAVTYLYVDGTFYGTELGSPTTQDFTINVGRRHDAANKNYFDGPVGFVVLHGVALTPIQVLDALIYARQSVNQK